MSVFITSVNVGGAQNGEQNRPDCRGAKYFTDRPTARNAAAEIAFNSDAVTANISEPNFATIGMSLSLIILETISCA